MPILPGKGVDASIYDMQINTNVHALSTMRHMATSSTALQASLQRLSTGARINSARDDAAGLAIADRMTSQLRGTGQAIRNMMDGVSMLQTAEGAISTVNETLQRIRELAVQAANGTNSSIDKEALQGEVNQLLAEIDRIGTTTTFNGLKIFSQSTTSIGGDANQRAVMDGMKLGWLENSEARIKQYYGIVGDGAQMDVRVTGYTDGQYGVAAYVSGNDDGTGKLTNLTLQADMADFTPANLPNGGNPPMYNDRVILHEMVHAVMGRTVNITSLSNWFIEGAAEFIHGADERLAGDLSAIDGNTGDAVTDADITALVQNIADAGGTPTWSLDSAHYSSGYAAVRYLHQKLKDAGEDGIKDFFTYLNQNSNTAGLDAAFEHFFGTGAGNPSYGEAEFLQEFRANGLNYIKNEMDLTNGDTGAVGGLDADGGTSYSAESIITMNGSRYGEAALEGFTLNFETLASSTPEANTLVFHVGYKANQTISTQVGAVGAQALGLAGLDIANLSSVALVHIDEALEYVNSQRAEIGAQLSRFETASRSLETSNINVAAARSRIMDADFAQETANLVRNQILQQSAMAMLAQAKAVPQVALQLLRGL